MQTSQAASRVERLAKALAELGADAFFASNPITMGYLHGFVEDGFERFLTLAVSRKGEAVLICPALSETQARRCGISDVRAWNDSEDPMELFKNLAEEWNLRTGILYLCGFMPAFMVLAMQDALPAALFKPGQEVLGRLMRHKDDGELRLMREAGSIADRALAPAINQLKPGMTEAQLAGLIQQEMKRLGGKPAFCIVAAGPNSAEPHHESDETPIEEGDVVLCDFGCSVGGYNSDTTRIVALGHAPAEAEKVYRIVYEAQRKAREAIRSGVAAGEIDRVARTVIGQAGYGDFFMHRTGHGIGLRAHEEPFIVQGGREPVEEGECFSVEPGIYLPGKFGVRIENIVTPTSAGHESFNTEPPETLPLVPV